MLAVLWVCFCGLWPPVSSVVRAGAGAQTGMRVAPACQPCVIVAGFHWGHAAQHNPDVNVLIHISLPCGGGQDLGQWCLLPQGRHALTADKSLLWAQVTAINNTGPANLTGGGGHTINGSQVYSVVCAPGLCSACLSTWQPQVERRPTEQLRAHLLSHLQEVSLWALLACQSRAICQCSTTAALPICLWRPKPQASKTGCTCIDV